MAGRKFASAGVNLGGGTEGSAAGLWLCGRVSLGSARDRLSTSSRRLCGGREGCRGGQAGHIQPVDDAEQRSDRDAERLIAQNLMADEAMKHQYHPHADHQLNQQGPIVRVERRKETAKLKRNKRLAKPKQAS